jgi:hypothetical protein
MDSEVVIEYFYGMTSLRHQMKQAVWYAFSICRSRHCGLNQVFELLLQQCSQFVVWQAFMLNS